MKSSELRKLLKGSMDDEAVDALIKARVDSGDVEDDETTAVPATFDVELVDAHVDQLKKALGAVSDGSLDDFGQADLFTALDDGEPDDDSAAVVMALAKATDSVVDRSDRLAKATVTGLVASAEQNAQLAKGLAALMQQQGYLLTKVDAIEKALGTPVPPRSLTGAQAVPSPADNAAAASADVGKQRDAYCDRATTLMKAASTAGNESEVDRMKKVIAELSEHGSDPTRIAAEYGL